MNDQAKSTMVGLKQFVHDTLIQIGEGVQDARGDLETRPHCTVKVDSGEGSVRFDLTVSAEESKSKDGKLGLNIGIPLVDVGGTCGTERTNASTTRIEFNVPIRFESSRSLDADDLLAR